MCLGFPAVGLGSLYVDFKYGGLLLAFLWGYLAARVYHKCKEGTDVRWFYLLAGFGRDLLQLINTPLGFGNGLRAFWMILTFFL